MFIRNIFNEFYELIAIALVINIYRCWRLRQNNAPCCWNPYWLTNYWNKCTCFLYLYLLSCLYILKITVVFIYTYDYCRIYIHLRLLSCLYTLTIIVVFIYTYDYCRIYIDLRLLSCYTLTIQARCPRYKHSYLVPWVPGRFTPPQFSLPQTHYLFLGLPLIYYCSNNSVRAKPSASFPQPVLTSLFTNSLAGSLMFIIKLSVRTCRGICFRVHGRAELARPSLGTAVVVSAHHSHTRTGNQKHGPIRTWRGRFWELTSQQ